MSVWILFWKFLFIAALIVFAGMAVWVTIGGFRDIKILFERLKEHSDEEE